MSGRIGVGQPAQLGHLSQVGHRGTAWWPCLLTACLSGWLAACSAPIAPRSALPAVEVPLTWSAGGAPRTGQPSNDQALTFWWKRFDDPLLASLVERASTANTSVVGAQAALRQAQALRAVAAAALRPTLGASASAQRGTAGGDSTGNRFQSALNGGWVPDAFGANQRALDASDAAALASAANLGDVQASIIAEVGLNYILLRSAQARLVIANSNLTSQRETLQIVQWRQQAGLASQVEADQALAAAEQTQAQLPALQTSIEQSSHALALLVGTVPLALNDQLFVSAPVPQAAEDPLPSVPAEVLRQRADVRAAEFQVAASLARVARAQALRLPSFSISGSLGLSAVTLGALTNGTSVLGALLASVNWPLIDGGAGLAQVNAQQAALEQGQQVYRAAVLGALRDVEDALTALRDDRLQLLSLRNAVQAATNASLLARQRYASGLIDFQVVLETQRSLFSSQEGVAIASAAVSTDQVRLFKALGGGWTAEAALR